MILDFSVNLLDSLEFCLGRVPAKKLQQRCVRREGDDGDDERDAGRGGPHSVSHAGERERQHEQNVEGEQDLRNSFREESHDGKALRKIEKQKAVSGCREERPNCFDRDENHCGEDGGIEQMEADEEERRC